MCDPDKCLCPHVQRNLMWSRILDKELAQEAAHRATLPVYPLQEVPDVWPDD